MRTDRRGFLALLASGLSAGLIGALRDADVRTAVGIHRATRNTRLGPIPNVLRLARGPATPWKTYPGAERLALPEAAEDTPGRLVDALGGTPAGAPSTPLSLEKLSRLLLLTNGVTGPRGQLRAAPSAGALYAGEVYVAAERVEGLPPGLYYYLVPDHAILRIGDAVGLDDLGNGAAAAVILTSVFDRYSWRYAARGYRYALIDTGHIGENLHLAARALDLTEVRELRFEDDRLHALLGVDGVDEAACAVHWVGGASTPGPARPLVELAHPTRGSETERYHAATKLVPGSVPPRPAQPEPGPVRKAPPGAPSTRVEAAIRMRRSASRFTAEAVSREQLALVLRAVEQLRPIPEQSALELRVVAHRVEGLPAGVYRHAAGQELEQVRGGDVADALAKACLGQKKAAEAAVSFLPVARIAEAAEKFGERSYRDLLIQAGSLAQRIYLVAESLGLAARNLAAFRDDELNALVGLDGRDHAVVHLTAFGPGE